MMRSLLGWFTRQALLRKLALSTPGVRDLAWRFVAGESLETGVTVVRALNGKGIAGTLNCVGTHFYRPDEVGAAAERSLATLRRIAEEKLSCHLSLKLTQIGLDVDRSLCERLLQRILAEAADLGVFVRLDMEEARYVVPTLQMFEEARARYGEVVGIALQSYLVGRDSDLKRLLDGESRIRLVKGGYWEPKRVAFHAKAEIDRRFGADLEQLMERGIDPAIATHDPWFIRRTIELAEKFGRKSSDFEFQMLYGVRSDLQAALVQQGYRVRCYVPYGGHWLSYFLGCLRRLPEGMLRGFKETRVGTTQPLSL